MTETLPIKLIPCVDTSAPCLLCDQTDDATRKNRHNIFNSNFFRNK